MDLSTACLIAALSISPGLAAGNPDHPPARPFAEPAVSLADQVPLPPPKRGRFKFLQQVGGDFKHFPSWDTAAWLAGGGGLALAVHPVDDDMNARLAKHEGFFNAGQFIGSGYVQVGTGARDLRRGACHPQRTSQTPGNGSPELTDRRADVHAGAEIRHTPRRPDHSDNRSFPSGHASATFASATVLQRHLGWKAALPTYTIASYVAISRMHENRHHLSDVVFGAALGIAAGRTTTRHGREHWALIPMFGKDAVGLMVAGEPEVNWRPGD